MFYTTAESKLEHEHTVCQSSRWKEEETSIEANSVFSVALYKLNEEQ